MNSKNILKWAVLVAAAMLAACGGGGGVTLGAFPAINATEGDAPITLTAPTSKSPAAFVFTSSNPQVATVNGNVLTILLAGTSTIMAQQPQLGSYNPTSTSALLTVKARVCTAPAVNQNGACVTPPTCTAPATVQNGVCTAPATTATVATNNGLTFMPATRADTWANANAFCNGTTINGATGWRLPLPVELADLYASGAMNGKNWVLGKTWSSNAGAAASSHQAVNLATGMTGDESDGTGAYVTCVR
ncbi:hypothetical protein Q4S45_19365 [Massilia sp. R2A-15]|uniref:hypothetical protein n=1 Tax=Massilia sp. R2A-15 TaxID=3064278 RepID=UPI00273641B0|nr:hypothetical protein [Massilia sp. R2A-15]WLI88842.1 hypothetical protein Q4S45_19365 [Massilia sp. R2A-15]